MGFAAAFGFLTKYSIGFFMAGLFLSVLLVDRKLLRNKMLWMSALLFLVVISPNVYWQIINHLPFLDHFSELYNSQLEKLSAKAELKSLLFF